MPMKNPHFGSSTNSVNEPILPTSSQSIRGSPRPSFLSTASGKSLGASSFTEKFSLSASPTTWGTDALLMDAAEPDDHLHNPDPKRDMRFDGGGTIFTSRGIMNLGCLAILGLGLFMLFAGYPVLTYFTKSKLSTQGGFNLGGINATGQIQAMAGNFGLIDPDTPQSARTIKSFKDGEEWDLVFSDEFNTDGRTFWPGDDPFWEAVDLWYWQTVDLEWYDPQQATTKDGSLRLKLEKADPVNNHNMSYKSGMIQTWNKFCFTGGRVEASVSLPGANNVVGLWPAVWTMGNLGRAGYGASLEGMWPYTYDTCDVGTLPNQTYPDKQTPLAALTTGAEYANGALSYLSGQRLSSCTCPGESHPGPVRTDGTYVGRSAPEIDIIEATITGGVGTASMSSQWAPFNSGYKWLNTSENFQIHDTEHAELNEYIGGFTQQVTSCLVVLDQDCYELEKGCYSVYAFEYKPGFEDAYITWFATNKASWTLQSGGMGPDPETEIGQRLVPVEPMYIIANLGFSNSFGEINFEEVTLPATMSVDYIRVYQPKGEQNIGCNPSAYPTKDYIETYKEAYTNANLTAWGTLNSGGGFNQPIPRNKLEQPGGKC